MITNVGNVGMAMTFYAAVIFVVACIAWVAHYRLVREGGSWVNPNPGLATGFFAGFLTLAALALGAWGIYTWAG